MKLLSYCFMNVGLVQHGHVPTACHCCGVSWQFFGRKVSFILSICIMCDRWSAGAEWVRHGKSMQGCSYWSMYRYAYGRYQGFFWWMHLASPPGTHGPNWCALSNSACSRCPWLGAWQILIDIDLLRIEHMTILSQQARTVNWSTAALDVFSFPSSPCRRHHLLNSARASKQKYDQ